MTQNPPQQPFIENEPAWVDTYAFRVLLPLVFIVSILIQLSAQPGIDQSWFALMTRRMLDGARLYRDITDPNLPMIMWLYALPVTLAGHSALHPVVAIKLGGIVLVALTLCLCARVLRASPLWHEKQRQSLLLALAGIMLLAADTHSVFAQREHLLVVFMLPYLLLSLPSVAGQHFPKTLRGFIGVWAAIGLCLKPHFIILWLAVLSYRRLHGLRSPADIALACTLALYVAAILIFTPDYLPMLRIVSRLYGGVGMPGETAYDKALWFVLLAAAGGLLTWGFRLLKTPRLPDTGYLVWMAGGAYLEALAQFKMWSYIAYPFMAIGMLAIVTAILSKPVNQFLAFAAMAWLFYPLTPMADSREGIDKAGYTRATQILAPYAQSKDFYYLGLTPPPPQSYRADPPLAWAGKFNRLFELPVILEPSPSGQPSLNVRPGMEGAERWLLESLADDLEKKQPDLIVAGRQWRTGTPPQEVFDVIAWLGKDPRFVRLMQHYTLQTESELCADPAKPNDPNHCSWRVFTRNANIP